MAKNKNPAISLIVGSRNRSKVIQKCLVKINPNDVISANAELILVDNNSDDDTYEVMLSFKESANFPVQVLNENTIGVSNVKNKAIEASKGELLVFTDDDCYLTDDYLQMVEKVFDATKFKYCGGKVLLWDSLDARLSVNLGEKFVLVPPFSFVSPGLIQGNNLIVHKDVAEKIKFDPLLGPGNPFICEDLDYVSRISMAGFTGAYVPEILLYHNHGRKRGSLGAKNIVKGYDYGLGAFFIKNILKGRISYSIHWIKTYFMLKRWVDDPELKPSAIRQIYASIWFIFYVFLRKITQYFTSLKAYKK